MDTKAVIGLIALVVIVGGGVWYFASGNQGTPEVQNAMVGDTAEGGPVAGAGTFMDLMRLGGSFECSVNDPVSGTAGKVYVSDTRFRGDFTAMMEGKTEETHVINADGYMYLWSNVTPQGFKMQAPQANSATGDGNDANAQQGVNMDTKVDYSCAPWMADAAAFSPPGDIEFLDFSTGAVPGMTP